MKRILFFTLLLVACNSSKNAWHGGEDKNDNGVRDDIESWINGKFNDKNINKAVMKLASIDPASCEYKTHIACLNQLTDDSILIQIELLEKTLDTNERRQAFDRRIEKCVITDDRNLNLKCDF